MVEKQNRFMNVLMTRSEARPRGRAGGLLRRRLTGGLSVLINLALVGSAFAHDGWLEAHPVFVELGQPLSLFMLFGNHSNAHRSYRIVAKWQPQYGRVVVIDPQGTEHDLSGGIVDLGEDADAVPPKGMKGFHVTPYIPAGVGLHVAVAITERELQFDGPKFRSIATAKVVFAALTVPTVAAAQALTGFDRIVAGDRALEIVPRTNPLAVATGDALTLEVRYCGQPASGRVVSIVRRLDGAPSAVDLTTDAQGRLTFTAGPPDLYLARVNVDDRRSNPDGSSQRTAYEATFVFPVVRRP